MRNLVITKSITDRDSYALKLYLNELNSFPVLTPNEEYELAVLATNGDEKAKKKLINHNLRFVVSVAKKYVKRGVKLEDLINEGNIALIKAADKFDPSRGFKFISYAVWLIRAKILTYIAEHSKTIKFNTKTITKTNSIRKQSNILEQKLERAPSSEELLNYINKDDYSENELDLYFSDFNNMIKSLNEPLTSDSESVTLLDLIEDTNDLNNNLLMSIEDNKIEKDILFSKLNQEEKDIINLSFGLEGDEPLNINEISEMLNIRSDKVARIKYVSLKKLKYQLLNNCGWIMNN